MLMMLNVMAVSTSIMLLEGGSDSSSFHILYDSLLEYKGYNDQYSEDGNN